MKPSLKFVSYLLALLLIAGCSRPYRHLQQSPAPMVSAMRFKPQFTKQVYRCIVDGKILFRKFHLSGLLLFKTFDDGSTRAVFQNEMGFSFFDFRWSDKDVFEVVSIMPQLNKPALIKLLKKDMNLLLMKQLDTATEIVLLKDNETYNRFTLEKGSAYYISRQGLLQRIENAGKSKVITITLSPKKDQDMPATLLFKHHKAHFTIDLKEIVPEYAP